MSGKLKEVRGRIQSVKSTQQITKAMKMVSAAKLRKAQDRIIVMRPYADKLLEILSNIVINLEGDMPIHYAEEREIKNVLLVAITSNRGLCGAFNSNVIKRVNKLIHEDYKGSKVTVITIGKKADDHFKHTEYIIKGTILPSQLYELYDDLIFENVAPVGEKFMEAFVNKQFDRVELVYNQFKNAAVHRLMVEQFLPIAKSEVHREENDAKVRPDFIFEPSTADIVQELIPKILKTQLFKAILDSNASEHGARMTAMDKATENANELLKELRLTYNRARQAAITTELTEIVGGANALESA